MAKGAKKMGRPKLDLDRKLGERLAFRPKKSVREYIDQKVEEGESTSVSNAINEAIDRLQETEQRQEENLLRTFGGGFHNLALAHLIARIAVGVEHKARKSWWSKKEGLDAYLLVQILLAFMMIVRDFVQTHLMKTALAEAIMDGFRFDRTREPWLEVVTEVRGNLRNPQMPWWPIGDTADDGPAQPENTTKFFANLPCTEDLIESLVDPLRRAVLNDEVVNFEMWLKQDYARKVKSYQSRLVQVGHQPEKMPIEELAAPIQELARAEQAELKATSPEVPAQNQKATEVKEAESKQSAAEDSGEDQEATEKDHETNEVVVNDVVLFSGRWQRPPKAAQTRHVGLS